jgi:AcrR family transcriptional regulator
LPRPRFQRAAIEKQEAILDAATAEFAARGYDDASVNRILLAAGFSKGLFYYYFDDKVDLAVAVVERLSVAYLESLDVLTEPKTPSEFWDGLDRLAKHHASKIRKSPTNADALLRLATALAHHPEFLSRITGSAMTEALSKVTKFWKRGQEIGAVRTDLPLNAMFPVLQEMKLALIRVLLPTDRAPSVEEAESFARMHLDLIKRIAERRD